MSSSSTRILVYLLRRDLRVSDNPVFHEISRLSSQSSSPFTHVLPIFVLPANQIEVSGFLSSKDTKSPFAEARGPNSGFWRCGPHRAKFLSDSIWDVKRTLDRLGSGLLIRVGHFKDVVDDLTQFYKGKNAQIASVWMTGEQGTEERSQEVAVKKFAESNNIDFKLWTDEKYYVDCRDLSFDASSIKDLPDVYTSFRKSLEPLRDRPRPTLPLPDNLPPLPPSLAPQSGPFSIPDGESEFLASLLSPLEANPDVPNPPEFPSQTSSAHPFRGGETNAQKRMHHLLKTGAASAYKDTRNGLLGEDFSTKLSAYLTNGCISARQIHAAMLAFEDGNVPKLPLVAYDTSTSVDWKSVSGYGKGENKGTAAIRFELLWRDYMRLCAHKFESALFAIDGFRGSKLSQAHQEIGDQEPLSNPQTKKQWHYLDRGGPGSSPEVTRRNLVRFIRGETGIGLIDASQKELILTGYTSNRARQNVASFLSSHLNIDWRLGAEWYESMLVDYDVGSNWGNWQYVAGVGNDPRLGRVFNPVKQALDYDARGEYVRAWVPELRGVDIFASTSQQGGNSEQHGSGVEQGGEEQVQQSPSQPSSEVDPEKLMGVYQAWRLPDEEKRRLGLSELEWVQHPLTKINFSVAGRGRFPARGNRGGRGRGWQGRGGRGGGCGRGGPRGGGRGFDRRQATDSTS